VQAVAWAQSDADWEPAWHLDDWGPLDRSRIACQTDENGAFHLAEEAQAALGWALWASHPGFVASCAVIDGAATTGSETLLVLEPGPPLRVDVVGPDGRGASAAIVHQYGTTPPSALRGEDGRTMERARRLFVERYETDRGGTAELGRFPGEVVLVASAGGMTSAPWRGIPDASVRLVLEECFTIGGSIAFPDWSHLNYAGERRLLVEVRSPTGTLGLASARNVVAGLWGPLTLPIVSAGRYTLRLEGSPIVPVHQEFDAPAPGEHLVVNLAPEVGHPLWIQALDERGKGIPDAEACSFWKEEGRERVLRRRGDLEGYIVNWSFPTGARVNSFVTAPGFAGQWHGEVIFPEATPVTHPVTLKQAASLAGRCMSDGKPVSDFEVVVWEPSRSEFTQIRREFNGRPDGSFEFSDAPTGFVAIAAATRDRPYSRPLHLTLPTRDPVVIDLAPPLPGRGQIVDLETGAAVPEARVQIVAVVREGPLRLWGSPHSVDSDGRFEFAGFVSGQNAVRVSAGGYTDREVRAVSLDGVVDFGRVSLDRPRTLELRLEAETAFDFAQVTAQGSGGTPPLPLATFDSAGFVRFEGAGAGTNYVRLLGSPQAPWISLRLTLDSGHDWSFSHKLNGKRRLTVEVGGTSEDLASIVGLSVSYSSPDGVHTELGLPFEPNQTLSLEGIDSDSACVRVMGPVKVMASAMTELRGEELHARLDLAEEPFVLRVVDANGAPVSGVFVSVSDTRPSALYLYATSTADGLCFFTGLPARPVLISLQHETLGRRLGVVVDGSKKEAVLVLTNDARLHLETVDVDAPIAGVRARASTASIGSRWSVLGHSDDGGQLVADNLGEGAYVVALDHPDCWPVTLEAKASSTPSPQRVQIRRRGALSFALRSPEGSAHAGKTLELHSLEFDTDVTEWLGEGMVVSQTGLTSDSKGEIRIERLPRGPYRYRLATSAGDWIEGRCEVLPGALISVPVELQ
jgi:hypothetical protein